MQAAMQPEDLTGLGLLPGNAEASSALLCRKQRRGRQDPFLQRAPRGRATQQVRIRVAPESPQASKAGWLLMRRTFPHPGSKFRPRPSCSQRDEYAYSSKISSAHASRNARNVHTGPAREKVPETCSNSIPALHAHGLLPSRRVDGQGETAFGIAAFVPG